MFIKNKVKWMGLIVNLNVIILFFLINIDDYKVK